MDFRYVWKGRIEWTTSSVSLERQRNESPKPTFFQRNLLFEFKFELEIGRLRRFSGKWWVFSASGAWPNHLGNRNHPGLSERKRTRILERWGYRKMRLLDAANLPCVWRAGRWRGVGGSGSTEWVGGLGTTDGDVHVVAANDFAFWLVNITAGSYLEGVFRGVGGRDLPALYTT